MEEDASGYQSCDMQALYGVMPVEELMSYAYKSGFTTSQDMHTEQLDGNLFLRLFRERSINNVLEVGCGFGRLGVHLLAAELNYQGIDLQEHYIDYFRSQIHPRHHPSILQGDFLNDAHTLSNLDCIFFPWTIMMDFTQQGQVRVLRKAKDLIHDQGYLFIDLPLEGMNSHEDYKPTPFTLHEERDQLTALDLVCVARHNYTTHTERVREIVELRKYKHSIRKPQVLHEEFV